MGRIPRAICAGTTYHLAVRGNGRQAIFGCDGDRQALLSLIDDVSRRRRWVHHAWCLMTNHVHLLTTTEAADIHDGMRDLLGRYSRWFGHIHGRSGHLFGGRYMSVVITDDEQLLTVVRYIANNPVRAAMVERAAEHPWSSYATSMRGIRPLATLDETLVLGMLHPHRAMALARMREMVEGQPAPSRVGPSSPAVGTLIAALGRDAGIRAAARLGFGHGEIAEAAGCSRSAVSQRLRRSVLMSHEVPGTTREGTMRTDRPGDVT